MIMRTVIWWIMWLVGAGGPPSQQQVHEPQALDRALAGATAELVGLSVPSASAFTTGDREIKAGSTAVGPVAVIGTLRVSGTIDGDAFAYGGDVVLLPGSHVTGSAVALEGRVRDEGGTVDGDVRSLSGQLTQVAPPPPPASTSHSVMLTLGWAAVALVVGIGLLVFGGPTLDAVGDVVDQRFGRSFVVGVAATLAFVPLLALLLVGLTLTVIGVLLVPFAFVAYVLAVIGLVTLGFLAAVRVTGRSLTRADRTTATRGTALQSLVVGLTFFVGLWLVAALLTTFPTAAGIARVIAFAVTWSAATVGLGATIISRAGTRAATRSSRAAPELTPAPEQAAAFVADWQTPTPVAGVVAARRRSAPTGRSS